MTEATKRLFKSYQLTRSQKSEVIAAWRDEPEAVERIASECRIYGVERGNSGAGLLLTRLRRGDHYPPLFTEALSSSPVSHVPTRTGWRWARGTHGGTFVSDPLGTDYNPRGGRG